MENVLGHSGTASNIGAMGKAADGLGIRKYERWTYHEKTPDGRNRKIENLFNVFIRLYFLRSIALPSGKCQYSGFGVRNLHFLNFQSEAL